MSAVPVRHVCAAALKRARDRLLDSGSFTLAQTIAQATQPLPGLSDDQGVWLRGSPMITDNRAQFDERLTHALPGVERIECDVLWERVNGEPDLLYAQEVLLRRALAPLAALADYPREQLFNAQEIQQWDLVNLNSEDSGSQPIKAITGIVKITRLCNLRCTYCHDWREGHDARMPFAVQLRTMQWLITGSGATQINVLLHGGEPSLIGSRGLLRLLMIQALCSAPGQSVRTRLQTNAARLHPDFLKLLVHFDISVSVSLDGPPEVHDKMRPDTLGRPSSRRVLDSIRQLNALGLLAGIVVVVSPLLIAAGSRRLLDFLCEEGISNVALLAMRPSAGTVPNEADSLSVRAYCDFLLEVHRLRNRISPWLKVREIDAVLAALHGGQAGTCELQGSCVGSYFGIEPDGRVMHCDKYVGDDAYVLGTVFDTFSEVAYSPRARALKDNAAQQKQAKAACRWWSACKGWCPHEDYVARALGMPNTACCGLSSLFDGLARDRHPKEVQHAQ